MRYAWIAIVLTACSSAPSAPDAAVPADANEISFDDGSTHVMFSCEEHCSSGSLCDLGPLACRPTYVGVSESQCAACVPGCNGADGRVPEVPECRANTLGVRQYRCSEESLHTRCFAPE